MNPDRQCVVVGFASPCESLGALQHGIALTHSRPDLELVVVHSASIPIAIKNGPSPQMAARLGDPVWASVHSTTSAWGAPEDRTTSIVASDLPFELIARHATNAALVLLGPHRRRWLGRRNLARSLRQALDCPIIRIGQAGLTEGATNAHIDLTTPISTHSNESREFGERIGRAA